MSKIASREIPSFFEIESGLVTNSIIDDQTMLLELLNDDTKGSVIDRARLLCLVTIASVSSGETIDSNFKPENNTFVSVNTTTGTTTGTTSTSSLITNIYEDAFVSSCKSILTPTTTTGTTATGTPTEMITYSNITVEQCLKTVSFIRKQLALTLSPSQLHTTKSTNNDNNDAFSSLLSSASSHATSLLAKATTFFSKFSPMYITKVVESLSEGRNCIENNTYNYLDAKASLLNTNNSTNNNANNTNSDVRYSDVIVFVIGGGCYKEYNK